MEITNIVGDLQEMAENSEMDIKYILGSLDYRLCLLKVEINFCEYVIPPMTSNEDVIQVIECLIFLHEKEVLV